LEGKKENEEKEEEELKGERSRRFRRGYTKLKDLNLTKE